jgi:hypothetical protein
LAAKVAAAEVNALVEALGEPAAAIGDMLIETLDPSIVSHWRYLRVFLPPNRQGFANLSWRQINESL